MPGMTAVPEVTGSFGSFEEALAYFRRKLNFPSNRWDDLRHGEHANGFMVAGVTRMAVLDDIRIAVDAAIKKGETLEDFRARFRAIVAQYGWPGGKGDGTEAGFNWRTSVIYHTNLRTAYMAGRWESLKKFPYLKYKHNSVRNPREQHLRWDGLVIATNDPWWKVHYPPNGWGCRCSVIGISEARLRVDGKTPDAAPAATPDDPPPEWAYNVGESAHSMASAEAFGKKVMALPPSMRDAALADAQGRQIEWFAPAWRSYVAAVRAEIDAGQPRLTGAASPAALLGQEAVGVLERAGVTPGSALIAMTDRQIAHAIRDAKQGQLSTLLEGLKSLPDWIGLADTVIFRDAGSIQFGRPLGDGRYLVAVLRLDSLQTRAKDRVQSNWITTQKVIGPTEVGKMERLK